MKGTETGSDEIIIYMYHLLKHNVIFNGHKFVRCRLTQFQDHRIFHKLDHFGIASGIVLEQNKFNKKLPLTGIEPETIVLWQLFSYSLMNSQLSHRCKCNLSDI